ncbi:MAG: chemotaxis protein CheW [Firmicutes bacterium]|nr:chemotaxis protein CheW [Bacillota bacterium]
MEVMEKSPDVHEEQMVIFQLSGQTYGVGISSVYEIIRMETITRVPRTPHFVEGVINLRGRIIPVIDLCKRLGLEDMGRSGASRIIIVDVGGQVIGIIVDSVSEVLRVPADTVEPPPPIVHGIEAAYLKGIAILGERLIILLDLNKILFEEEVEELKDFCA